MFDIRTYIHIGNFYFIWIFLFIGRISRHEGV